MNKSKNQNSLRNNSKIASGNRSNWSRKSLLDNSGEVVDVVIKTNNRNVNQMENTPHQNSNEVVVDIGSMHMFKTLDTVFVEQNSYVSRGQKLLSSTGRQRERQQSGSSHRASKRSLHVANNTSLEYLSSSGEKPKKVNAPEKTAKNTGGDGMIKVMDDYEPSADSMNNYMPFNKKNADLNEVL